MIKKKSHTDKKINNNSSLKFHMSRTIGIVLIIISFGVYIQALPLMLILLGGIIGVMSDGQFADVDTIVWAITSIGVLVPTLYAMITFWKFLWKKFVLNASKLNITKIK